ncbi:MAG: GNAT family N-acetyltransferase [Deltaproteobacteria bacterium]|nr:GNAT family N-acetyltransferase [Candidatus Zymogenaceae bacterium]
MRVPKNLNGIRAGVHIRPAEADDLDAVVYLWQEMMAFHVEQNTVFTLREDAADVYGPYAADCIANGAKLTLVAEEDCEIVGYIFGEIISPPPVYPGRKWGVVNEICVSEMHQNMGLGTELLYEAERWFFKNDAERIECRVAVTNPVSQRFWKKHGYAGYIKVCIKEL